MQFRLLGPFEASTGEETLSLGGGKQRALLARLLMSANQVVSVERLVDDLWGERAPETAVKSVQIYVSRLRKALPAGRLETKAPGYLVRVEAGELDTDVFESRLEAGREALGAGRFREAGEVLREALSLWRGAALAEFEEPFASLEAGRLEELRLACIEARVEADLSLGRHAELVGELDTLVGMHPLRERLRAHQLVALYRSGRQAEALACYSEFRRRLDEELGIEPSPRLRELERQILRQDPALEPPTPASPAPAATLPVEPAVRTGAAVRASAPATAGSLVGRDGELARLRRLLADAAEGNRQIVLISGQAGIGKTALVRAFLAELDATELLIARGQCFEQYGAGEPYMPVLEALGRLCRGPGGEELLRIVGDHAPTWVAELSRAPRQREGDPTPALGPGRDRMLRELVQALEAIAAVQPLVLVLEDLHWSDASTVDALSALVRRDDPARLLVLATYRRQDARASEHPVWAAARELELRGLVSELSLSRLTPRAVVDYVEMRFPGNGFPVQLAQLLYERTDGTPLFLEKVVDAWIDGGAITGTDGEWVLRASVAELSVDIPATIRQLIELQLDGLDPEDEALVEAASCAGKEFASAVVAAATEQDEEAVESRLAELAAQDRFVRAVGEVSWADGTVSSGFAFVHDLYVEIAYGRLPPGRRARLHRSIGARLEAGCGDRAHELASELASHFVRGRDPQRAVRYLRIAAEQAEQRSAYGEATAHVSAALELVESLDDATERARAELALQLLRGCAVDATKGYASPEVGEAFGRAHELAVALGDLASLLRALFGLCGNAHTQGRHRAAIELSEQFLQVAEAHGDPAIVVARRSLAWPLFATAQHERAREQLELALASYDPEVHLPLRFRYLLDPHTAGRSTLCFPLWFTGRQAEAHAHSDEAVASARAVDHVLSLAQALGLAAILAHLARDVDRAFGLGEEATSLAAEHDLRLWRGWPAIPLGWALVERGQVPEGIARLERGIATIRATGASFFEPYALATLAEACSGAGDPSRGLRLLDEALEVAVANDEIFYLAELHRLRGELLLAGGEQTGAAEEALELAVATAREQGSRSLELRAALSLGRLWTEQGQTEKAAEAISEAVAGLEAGLEAPDLALARDALRDLGAPMPAPRPAGRPAAERPVAAPGPVRHARSGETRIAYQVVGDGPIDIVVVHGWVCTFQPGWEDPRIGHFYRRLAAMGRLILFDKRGTGLSDRVSPDRLPDLETRIDDVRAVMDAVGSERALMVGISEGGPMAALFAATHPERTAGLVLIGTFARLMWAPDYPLGSSVRDQERRLAALEADDWLEQTASEWLARVAPGLDDEERLAWYRTYLMRGASPAGARALRLMNQEIDVRDVLPVIGAPTLVLFRGGEWYAEGSRYVGEHVPGARIIELPGDDHLPWEGDADELLDEIERFVENRDGQSEQDRRVLATILSIRDTVRAGADAAGERPPAAELPGPLRSRLRAQLGRFRGREVDGGGVTTIAAFDGPARAIRCGIAIVEAARSLGIELRAGLHTGEVELDGAGVSGPAVAVAEGLAAGAEPWDVVISQTVKDLVAGSGLRFAGPVPLTLPGDPGEWAIYTVEDAAVDDGAGTARAG